MRLVLHSCSRCQYPLSLESAFVSAGSIVIQCLACGADNLVQADVPCAHPSCPNRPHQLFVQRFLFIDYVTLCPAHVREKPWLSRATQRPTQSDRRRRLRDRALLKLLASGVIAYYSVGPVLGFLNRTVLDLTRVPTFRGFNVLTNASWLVLTALFFVVIGKLFPSTPRRSGSARESSKHDDGFRKAAEWYRKSEQARIQAIAQFGRIEQTGGGDYTLTIRAAHPTGGQKLPGVTVPFTRGEWTELLKRMEQEGDDYTDEEFVQAVLRGPYLDSVAERLRADTRAFSLQLRKLVVHHLQQREVNE